MSIVEIRQLRPQPVASIRRTIPVADLPGVQGESLQLLWRLLHDREVVPAGSPFVRYHTFGDTDTDMEVGVPVAEALPGEGPIAAGELAAGPAVVTEHLGAHDRLEEAYERIEEWLAAHQSERNAPAWEVYHWIDLSHEPDPGTWPAPEQWRTDIVQPIR